MLTWGIFAGAILLFGSIGALGRKQPTWMYRWFKPWGANGEAGFIRRVKLALSPSNHVYTLPLFWPLLAMLVAWAVLGIVGAEFPTGLLPGAIIGYTGAAMLSFPIDLNKTLSNYRKQVAIFAAQKLARRANPEAANAILVPLTKSPQPNLRIAAAMGLRELGTQAGADALRLLGTDQDVFVATAARDAYSDLHQVYQGNVLLSVRTMDTYVAEHQYLVAQLRRKKRTSRYAPEYDKLDEITRQIDEIVFSQLPQRRSFPDTFCQDCYARAEHLHYEEWDWVRCRQCKEVHGLRPQIQQVIGQIGGDVDWDLQNGILRVNLWDETQRKGRPADLDVLEIIAGKPINYDWAVSAVVEKMHNQSLGVGMRVAVKLTGAPLLEPNTHHLLKTLDPSLIVAVGEA
jgi:hypothetical protein